MTSIIPEQYVLSVFVDNLKNHHCACAIYLADVIITLPLLLHQISASSSSYQVLIKLDNHRPSRTVLVDAMITSAR